MKKGSRHTAEAIAKLRQAALGRVHDEETKARMRTSHKKRGRLVKKLMEQYEAQRAEQAA